MDISGRVVLVTGANRGLGKALASELRAAGASKIYAAVRNPDSLATNDALPIALDVTDDDAARAVAKKCQDVDILINNAGIFNMSSVLSDGASENIKAQLETNVFGILNVTRAFAPVLARNGGGAVVNVLSVLSWIAIEGTTPYSVSKAAAWALSNGLRRELKSQQTAVFSVHAAYIDTDMTAGLNVPKTSAREAARYIIDGIKMGNSEILVDETTRTVRSALGMDAAPYL